TIAEVADAGQQQPVIRLGTLARRENDEAFRALGARPAPGREGYHLVSSASGIVVAGADERGVLFGVGRLLRALDMRRGRVVLPDALPLTETPVVDVRGHQLGYRLKTNSYDGWDVSQWRQYMR